MKYDATGKKEEEITAEVLRLYGRYEEIEILRADGKTMIVCRKRRKAGPCVAG